MIDDVQLARVVHVVSVLAWIGGVSFVTLVLIPSLRRTHAAAERLAAFHALERRFAPQARVWVALAGASGFWMAYRSDLWSRFSLLTFWWMDAMVLVWALFAFILFVAEPLVLHRRMRTSVNPAADFDHLEAAHRALLASAVVAVIGAVGGSHGLF